MPVEAANSEETPYGRYITSEGRFPLNLADALAVRSEEKGGACYPLEGREARFRDFGVNVRVLWPGDPNGLYHAETGQEGSSSSRVSARCSSKRRSGHSGNGTSSTPPPRPATSSSAPATGRARSS